MPSCTLPKQERICGKKDISSLLGHAVHGYAAGLRYCYVTGTGSGLNRIMVTVSKKFFKRAVMRNLLKRRIRESYRTQKTLLPSGNDIDILFMYNTKDVLDYQSIHSSVGHILKSVASAVEKAVPDTMKSAAPAVGKSELKLSAQAAGKASAGDE